MPMPNITFDVTSILPNKRLAKIKMRAKKAPVSKRIQSLADAIKEYEESFARLKNMNNQQWRALIRNPERFESLKVFLAETPRYLTSWKKDIEKINSTLESLQRRKQSDLSGAGTSSSQVLNLQLQ